jgi:hypothetical protein
MFINDKFHINLTFLSLSLFSTNMLSILLLEFKSYKTRFNDYYFFFRCHYLNFQKSIIDCIKSLRTWLLNILSIYIIACLFLCIVRHFHNSIYRTHPLRGKKTKRTNYEAWCNTRDRFLSISFSSHKLHIIK